ncbi:uncharacterized protein LOC141672004 isoform X4 [Apium graveolens]|uniref:uncharacterized protein LOC141672004 isoform X4 n=1 Tax=Apium graveolens TaxID=4045 RepID=UPI003D7BFDD4
MRSENEDQISRRDCVIKQVKIVNNNSNNDCPRLSVRPGSNSFSGIKYNFWAGSRRIRIREPNTSLNPIDNRINTSSSTRNSKKKRRKIYNIRSKPRRRLLVAGFFQAQIRMMKSKHQRKMTYNRSTGTSVPNRISSCGSTSSSSVLIKRKGKMTYNRSTGTSVPNRTSSCGSTSSSSVLIKRKGKITLIDNASPILKKHRKIPDNLNGRTIDDLPKELLAEILKRLPVKYILRCRMFMRGIVQHLILKTLRSTVALLAARGRGKSAALGLAISGAIAAGYSHISVTAPSPENLKTLFEFICKGFDTLDYKEHLDYDIVQSNNPDFKKATVRINVYKQHRQTIQYIQPHEHEKLSQVELLVVHEAAASPLPVVKSLLGPYLVFFSSTVNGYEGTGRSLSLKLLQRLEEQSRVSTKKSSESSLSGLS